MAFSESDDLPSGDSSASPSSGGDLSGDSSSSAQASAPLDPTRWSGLLSSAISSNGAVRSGNTVTALIDGEATFKEMVRAIGTATGDGHYIYLLGWQLVDDFDMESGSASKFKDLMATASGSGVQVRVMLWKQYQGINKPQVDSINTLANGAAILDNATPNAVVGSHHQKVLVVKGSDGLITFCGGIDINSDRISPSTPGSSSGLSSGEADEAVGVASSGGGGNGSPLHDVHCEIVGPSAWDVLQTFLRRWAHHPDSAGIDTAKGALLGASETVPVSSATTSSPLTCSVAIGRTFNPITPGTTVPRERDIETLLLVAIANAQRFIYMEDQYLINLDAANALNKRIPSLAHLTILLAGSEISDLPCRWKYRADFINAVTSGLSASDIAKVRVFRLVTPPATTPPVYGAHTYVHAKTWVFDDELAVIGSANCNLRGWQSDSEVNAFIFDDAAQTSSAPTFAQQLRQDLWAEHLGVPASSVSDGVASASLWLTSTPAARVSLYDPAAGGDASWQPCGTQTFHDLVDPPSP